MKLGFLLLSSLLLAACGSPALHQDEPWPTSEEDDVRRGVLRGDPSRPIVGEPVPQPPN